MSEELERAGHEITAGELADSLLEIAGANGVLDAAGAPRELELKERVQWLFLRLRDASDSAIPPADIIDGATIREMTGTVNRRTLQRWRELHGFPEPFATVGGGKIDLWDARKVRAWLEARA